MNDGRNLCVCSATDDGALVVLVLDSLRAQRLLDNLEQALDRIVSIWMQRPQSLPLAVESTAALLLPVLDYHRQVGQLGNADSNGNAPETCEHQISTLVLSGDGFLGLSVAVPQTADECSSRSSSGGGRIPRNHRIECQRLGFNLQLSGAMAIVRMVNGVTGAEQKGKAAMSVTGLADKVYIKLIHSLARSLTYPFRTHIEMPRFYCRGSALTSAMKPLIAPCPLSPC